MKTSESIKNLTQALLKAQMQMGSAVKGAKNPFFKSNYADLPTVMEVVKGPYNENGILVMQPPEFIDGRNFIKTVLVHAETGEWLESTTEVICSKQNDPQAFGAAQTYARRFSLQSLAFVPSEDDDGNLASGRTAAKSGHSQPLLGRVLTTNPPQETTNSILISQGTTTGNVIIQDAAATTASPNTGTTTKVSNFKKKPTATAVVTAAQAAPASGEWA